MDPLSAARPTGGGDFEHSSKFESPEPPRLSEAKEKRGRRAMGEDDVLRQQNRPIRGHKQVARSSPKSFGTKNET